MKKFIQVLQVVIFLLMISMPMFMQAGTITNLIPNDVTYIDISANSKVRFTFNADITLAQQVLVFLERDANGMITNTIGTFSGYGSGTFCTTLPTGKAAVMITNSGGSYAIEYFADSPSTVNGDLAVAGNQNIYGRLTVMTKLGVGTTNPTANLHVLGSNTLGTGIGNYVSLTKLQNNIHSNQLYVNDYLVREGIYNGTWQSVGYLKGIGIDASYSTPSTLRSWIKQKPYDEKIEFGSSGSTYMSVGSRVGIGTTNPSNKFEVVNSNSGTLDVAGFYNTYAYGNSSKAEARINLGKIENNTTRQSMGAIGAFPTSNYDSNNGNLAFYTRKNQNLVECIRINQDGKVGIGLNNPENTFSSSSADIRLFVNGAIQAKEIKVSFEGLADYVFDANYNLMPLSEVEQFVYTHKHLPSIPSAAEVQNNGMDLGEMQNKLLQKIEELTLYIIEQQKEINLLKQELKK